MKIKQLEWKPSESGFYIEEADLFDSIQYCVQHDGNGKYKWVRADSERYSEYRNYFDTIKDAKIDCQKHWEETLMQFIES